ncbi:MAG: hypothetical protein ACOVMP_06710 [Chthoniobacterales bacterium]
MKNSEEYMVRWMDDAMPSEEAAEFEKSLPDAQAARGEKSAWHQLRVGLKSASATPPEYARDADFLKSQISRGIRETQPGAARRETHPLPSIWRLVWSGAGLCACAALLSVVVIRHNDGIPDESAFISQVIEARSANPSRYDAYSFTAPDGRGTVIWMEDPGFIPAQESIR